MVLDISWVQVSRLIRSSLSIKTCRQDTWVEVPRLFRLSMTQPDKLHLHEFHHVLWKHVHPLLMAMETKFGDISLEMDLILTEFNSTTIEIDTCNISTKAQSLEAFNLMMELRDSIRILALRAKQVRILYQSKDPHTVAERR